ncbi:T9SS type A sorting domain-containing protein [uncultured Algibacter sp.]|uniref:T9SS type A sorting domain-containing protein n=1 Tax=uncultured Algibacter sp. TaxID=298659 RepID=UPI003216D7CD
MKKNYFLIYLCLFATFFSFAQGSIAITSPANGQVFPSSTTEVSVFYDITGIPNFEIGTDGLLEYTVWKNADIVSDVNNAVDVIIDVSEGTYVVEIQVRNIAGDRIGVANTVNFSVEAFTRTPGINIFSLFNGEVFPSSTTSINVNYDVLGFDAYFDNGTVVYSLTENDVVIADKIELTISSFDIDVKEGATYELELEVLDKTGVSFSPSIKGVVNFSVEAATTMASVVISSPAEAQVFPSTTTEISIDYEVTGIENFIIGSNGFVDYTVIKNGDLVSTVSEAVDVILDVTEGDYQVEIEVTDMDGNGLGITDTVNFSVEAFTRTPGINIFSLFNGEVFPSSTTSINVNYDVLGFDAYFDNGTVVYSLTENDVVIADKIELTISSFDIDVKEGATYELELEVLDKTGVSFSPSIKGVVNFSVEAATTMASVVISSPAEAQVFPSTTTEISIDYEVTGIPNFIIGSNGFVDYTVIKNGDLVSTIIQAVDIILDVTEGDYQVEIEVTDMDGNSLGITDTVNFSVEASLPPSIVITSPNPDAREVLSPLTTEVIIDYEINNFDDFNGFVKYSVFKDGSVIIEEDDFTDIIFDTATSGDYQVTVELLDSSKEPFSPRIQDFVNFFVQDAFRQVISLRELGNSDRNTFYEITDDVVVTFVSQNERNQIYIQDNTRGFLIDDPDGIITTNYEVGDVIRGLRGKYIELLDGKKLIPVEDPGAPISSNGSVPIEELTLAELINDIDAYESQKVKITKATFDDADGVKTFDSSVTRDYTISYKGESMNFRIEFDNLDIEGTIIPEGSVTITGIVGKSTASTSKGQNTASTLPQIFATGLSDITLSTDDVVLLEQNLKVYPNPITNSIITVEGDFSGDEHIDIYDALGHLVISENITERSKTINVSSLNSGLFIMKVTQETGRIIIKKLVKQ